MKADAGEWGVAHGTVFHQPTHALEVVRVGFEVEGRRGGVEAHEDAAAAGLGWGAASAREFHAGPQHSRASGPSAEAAHEQEEGDHAEQQNEPGEATGSSAGIASGTVTTNVVGSAAPLTVGSSVRRVEPLLPLPAPSYKIVPWLEAVVSPGTPALMAAEIEIVTEPPGAMVPFFGYRVAGPRDRARAGGGAGGGESGREGVRELVTGVVTLGTGSPLASTMV